MRIPSVHGCYQLSRGSGGWKNLPGDNSERTLKSAKAFRDKLVNRMFQSESRARTVSERRPAGRAGRFACCNLNSSYVEAIFGPPIESFLISSAACSMARAS